MSVIPSASIACIRAKSKEPQNCATAEIGHRKAHPFFFGKGNHVKRATERSAGNGFGRRDAEQYAQHAVKLAGVGHGIDVRTDGEYPFCGSATSADQVSDGVTADGKPGTSHPSFEQFVNSFGGRTEKCPPQTARLVADLTEGVAASENFVSQCVQIGHA